MKVVLTSDVKSLGSSGAVVDVADGYARNYLLPRDLAVEASTGSLAEVEAQRRAKARREAETLAQAKALAERLEAASLSVEAKSGGSGRLFGAVTNGNVAEAIVRQLGVAIDRHKIELPESIKALGTYPVEVRLGKDVVAKTTVNVVAGANK